MSDPYSEVVVTNPPEKSNYSMWLPIIGIVLIIILIGLLAAGVYTFFIGDKVSTSADSVSTLRDATTNTADNINKLLPLVQTTFTNINNAVPVLTGTAKDVNELVDQVQKDVKEVQADIASLEGTFSESSIANCFFGGTGTFCEIVQQTVRVFNSLETSLVVITNSARVSQEYYCSLNPSLSGCPGVSGAFGGAFGGAVGTFGTLTGNGTTLIGNSLISNGVLSTPNGAFCVGSNLTNGLTGNLPNNGVGTEFVSHKKSKKSKHCRKY